MSTVGRGATLAALAGVALFATMFVPWFGESGWSSMGWFAIGVIALAIICAVAFGLVHYAGTSVSAPVALSSVACGLGAIAFAVVLYRAIDPPGEGEIDREVGLYIGLLATAGIALGGYLGMQEEPYTRPRSELPG